MQDTTPTLAALRKAAIVISALDPPAAEALLGKMPGETAERVLQLVAQLNAVPDAEREMVLREFVQAGGLDREESFEGVELDPDLAEKLQVRQGFSELPSPAPRHSTHPLFGFLEDATTDALFRHLERQHPQLIAVITSHLPPIRAAELIQRFPPRVQADLLRRVAELDVTEQEVLADIAAELQSLLSDDLRQTRNRQNGLATISSILNAAGSERRTILDSLSRYDGDLATDLTGTIPRSRSANGQPASRQATLHPSQSIPPRHANAPAYGDASDDDGKAADAAAYRRIRSGSNAEPAREESSSPRLNVSFEELSALSDHEWALLFRAAEQPIVMLALTGASEQLLQRITRRLSRRESQLLRERLEQTGPLRLSDIEQAQRYVAEVACRLIASGKIKPPERRGFAAAA